MGTAPMSCLVFGLYQQTVHYLYHKLMPLSRTINSIPSPELRIQAISGLKNSTSVHDFVSLLYETTIFESVKIPVVFIVLPVITITGISPNFLVVSMIVLCDAH